MICVNSTKVTLKFQINFPKSCAHLTFHLPIVVSRQDREASMDQLDLLDPRPTRPDNSQIIHGSSYQRVEALAFSF